MIDAREVLAADLARLRADFAAGADDGDDPAPLRSPAELAAELAWREAETRFMEAWQMDRGPPHVVHDHEGRAKGAWYGSAPVFQHRTSGERLEVAELFARREAVAQAAAEAAWSSGWEVDRAEYLSRLAACLGGERWQRAPDFYL